jgi:hypothetical protein
VVSVLGLVGLLLGGGKYEVSRLVKVNVGLDFPVSGEVSKTLSGIKPGFNFNEVIPSWNLDNAVNGGIRIELKPSESSRWFILADWSGDKTWSARESVDQLSDEFARVSTDTLKLKSPAKSIDLRITLKSRGVPPLSRLKLLTLCFADTTQISAPEGFGGVTSLVDVPERAQGNYPNGKVLCSATSTSMLLSYWSKVLDRPELDHDVPDVEQCVWDPVYKGAGNWSFNAAYFGSFPGLKACVSRLRSIRDLEELTAAGIPVATSVSFDILRGRPLSKGESGHLILVVGFLADGTPIINDPAFKDGVRKTYPREDFEKAWQYSKRTVYIMIPDSQKLPRDTRGLWNFR